MARVLIIDDDPVFQEIAGGMLGDLGHAFASALDGHEAIRRLEQDPCFDLCLVDIFMPEKDGLEVILELRQARPDLRLVAVSGARPGQGDQLRTARAFGAHAALPKPIVTAQLADLVDRLTTAPASHSSFI